MQTTMATTWTKIDQRHYPYIISDHYLAIGNGDFELTLVSLSVQYEKKWSDEGWIIDKTKIVTLLKSPPIAYSEMFVGHDPKIISACITALLVNMEKLFKEFLGESSKCIPQIELPHETESQNRN